MPKQQFEFSTISAMIGIHAGHLLLLRQVKLLARCVQGFKRAVLNLVAEAGAEAAEAASARGLKVAKAAAALRDNRVMALPEQLQRQVSEGRVQDLLMPGEGQMLYVGSAPGLPYAA